MKEEETNQTQQQFSPEFTPLVNEPDKNELQEKPERLMPDTPHALPDTYKVTSRAVDGLFGRSQLTLAQQRAILDPLTEEQRNALKNRIDKSSNCKSDEFWCVINEKGYIYNIFTPNESKLILAMQAALYDQEEQTGDPHKLIQDAYKESKLLRRKGSTEEDISAKMPFFKGFNPALLPLEWQKVVADTTFKKFGVIIIEPTKFLHEYLGLELVQGDDRATLINLLNKLAYGRFAIFDKNTRGGDVFKGLNNDKKNRYRETNVFVSIQDPILQWHEYKETDPATGKLIDYKIIIVLGPMFCDVANNYRRLPIEQPAIFRRIGHNLTWFKIYLYILTEMSKNEVGESRAKREDCKKVEITEEKMLEKFKTEEAEHRARQLNNIYNGFKMLQEEFNLLCKPLEFKTVSGEKTAVFWVNRGVFRK